MRKTAHLPPSWWLADTRQKLVKRSCDHLAVFVAMTTSPGSHVSGVAYLPPYDVAYLLNLPVDRVKQVIADMEQDGIVVYDAHHSIVWVVGAIEAQLGSQRWRDHPKWLDPTISYLENLPASVAIERFLTHYRLTDRIGYRYPMDTLSIGSSYPFLSSPLPSSIPPDAPRSKIDQLPAQDEDGLDVRDAQEVDP